MHVHVQSAEPVIRGENLHLSHGKILNLEIDCPCPLDFGDAAEADFFVSFFENTLLLHRHSSSFSGNSRRGIEEVAGSFLVACTQQHDRIGSR